MASMAELRARGMVSDEGLMALIASETACGMVSAVVSLARTK